MAKQYAFLDYTFIFDANRTWGRLSQFERDLADFFLAHGYQAEIVETVSGQVGKRLMLIEPIDQLRAMAHEDEKAQKKVQSALEMRKDVVKKIPRDMKVDTKIFNTKDKSKKLEFKSGRNNKSKIQNIPRVKFK